MLDPGLSMESAGDLASQHKGWLSLLLAGLLIMGSLFLAIVLVA